MNTIQRTSLLRRQTVTTLLGLGLALAGISVATPSDAHIRITAPATRNANLLKGAPCGGAVGRANVMMVEPGATITLTWNKYVEHPGYFRISFDDEGEDFVYPLDQAVPAPEDPPFNDQVLINMIPNEIGRTDYSAEVTLPDLACDNCTLQLLQVMTEMPGKTPTASNPTNHLYFQCLDLVLAEGAGSEPTPLDAEPPAVGEEPPASSGENPALVPQGPGDDAPEPEPEPNDDMPSTSDDPEMTVGVNAAGGCAIGHVAASSGALAAGVFTLLGWVLRRRRSYPS